MKIKLRNFGQQLETEDFKGVSQLLNSEDEIRLLIILCPLFKTGELEESVLLSGQGCSISESRICSKWDNTISLIDTIQKDALLEGKSIHIDFIFADNGTPSLTLSNADKNSLLGHEKIWRNEIESKFKESPVDFDIHLFSDIVPEVPTLIDVNNFSNRRNINQTNNAEEFIKLINLILTDWFSIEDSPVIEVNRKNKKRVKRLLGVFSFDTALGMCTTYLAKRFRLPVLFPKNIFLWFERMDVLLTIDDMLDEFQDVKKIMMKV